MSLVNRKIILKAVALITRAQSLEMFHCSYIDCEKCTRLMLCSLNLLCFHARCCDFRISMTHVCVLMLATKVSRAWKQFQNAEYINVCLDRGGCWFACACWKGWEHKQYSTFCYCYCCSSTCTSAEKLLTATPQKKLHSDTWIQKVLASEQIKAVMLTNSRKAAEMLRCHLININNK